MNKLPGVKDCTGCSACSQVCPKHAITMLQNDEGFFFPSIDSSMCVECGICQRKCPALKTDNIVCGKQRAYALISNQDRIVSSSGGAFSVFSRIVLEQNGIVFGASLDENLKCKHIFVDCVEDLAKLRGAKYVQSEIGHAYQDVKNFLKENRKVLFSGTPCQIAGLYSYLGGRYEDLLITLDLVCHGVPSQKMLDSYFDKLSRAKKKKVTDFQFRKMDSWSIIPSVKYDGGSWEKLCLWENAYMSAFFRGITFRESCFNCRYCNTNRTGTFTIADFWGLGGQGIPFKKNISQGVSLVLDNSDRMKDLIDDVKRFAYVEERSLSEAVEKQHNLKSPMQRRPERDFAPRILLAEDKDLIDFSKSCNLPYKNNLKSFVKKIVKDLIDKCGLYNLYKTVSYKMGKNS